MTKKIHATLLAIAMAAPLGASAQEIKLGDTTLKFNGFAEMALVYVLSGGSGDPDLYQSGPSVTLDSSAPDPKLRMPGFGIAYSRFGLSTNTPSKAGAIGVRIEGDFALNTNETAGQTFTGSRGTTNPKIFRVRHAYGTVGDWLLVGQTWSTFADLGAFQDQIDENPTVNLAALRNPMIRISFPAGPAKIHLAAENPYRIFPNQAPTRYTLPDLIGRVDFAAGPAALSVRGMVHQYITDDPSAAGDTELSAYGFGGAIGAAIKIGGDTLVLDASYGSAMGVYQYGNYGTGDFVVVTTGGTSKIEKWSTFGLSGGFTHVWTPEWRSNLIAGLLMASENKNIYTAAANTFDAAAPNKSVLAISGNTIYSFAKNAWVGVEVWYNKRETFSNSTANNKNNGSEFRALATTHFDFF